MTPLTTILLSVVTVLTALAIWLIVTIADDLRDLGNHDSAKRKFILLICVLVSMLISMAVTIAHLQSDKCGANGTAAPPADVQRIEPLIHAGDSARQEP